MGSSFFDSPIYREKSKDEGDDEDVYQIEADFNAKVEAELNKMIERVSHEN